MNIHQVGELSHSYLKAELESRTGKQNWKVEMLVIFDCDGVLVDSETLAAKVFAEILHGEGVRGYSPERCMNDFRGLTLSACLTHLQERHPGALPDDFISKLERATAVAFAAQLKPVVGVVQVVEQLARVGRPFCVASNGGFLKMRHSLEITGLWSYFEGRSFSSEWVAQGKPAPDLFLLAAESLGVPPAFCIVVEDSSAGVHAALAAGMRVLQYTADTPAAHKDVPVFSSMDQLPGLLHTR